ncbi:hypothetical protein P4H71_11580 [Paenibacillus kribbensis]|uniref:hypothetical protein n=1 Tax=Paenibacillus kribbensis TaxID=172713 RepID=UPI002DBEB81C|nr:hypothetical protein [Paenibacillus kribbensis]MEC0234968.1 hypothetical protein [Paenibacillus kribbensis]
MEKIETSLVSKALELMSVNQDAFFPHYEYKQIEQKFQNKWFQEIKMNSKICSICNGRTCRVDFEEIDKFVICPNGEQEVIEIAEIDRTNYRLKIDLLYQMLQEQLNTKEIVASHQNYRVLGEFIFRKEQWQLVFTFKHNLSLSSIIDLKLNQSSQFILVALDDALPPNDFETEIYKSLGVFFVKWDQQLFTFMDHIYDQDTELMAIKDLANEQTAGEILNSILTKTATDGKGGPFERAVFKGIKKLFHVVLPFGSNLSGFSIPDGLIIGRNNPFPTLFYDCKSFNNDSYIHKAEIAMQANYYGDFLTSFYNKKHYAKTGFIIFASSFPDDVQKQITGSAQWKYVFENFKIFFVSIGFIKKAIALFELFDIQNDQMNKKDFFEFCFEDKFHLLQDSEVESYYKKINSYSAYENYRFLDELVSEVGLITSIVNEINNSSDYEPIKLDLKNAIIASKHENLNRSVKKPVLFWFIKSFLDKVKDNTIFNVLHPLSVLLVLKRIDDIEIQLNEKICNKLYDEAIAKLEVMV